MSGSVIKRLRFYNGREHSIDKEQLYEFETRAVVERYYSGRDIDASALLEDLGPTVLDFTNAHHWSKEIPDIDPRSARLFTLWAEDEETSEIYALFRGFYVLLSYKWGETYLKDYYFFNENQPYYPMALISSFRTIIRDEALLDELLDRTRNEIELNWRKLRQKLIETLEKNTDLWRRYVLCFDKIVHFSFLCPSIDRELIDSLRRRNYRTTGVLQLLASPTPSYNQMMVKLHLKEVEKIMKKYGEE